MIRPQYEFPPSTLPDERVMPPQGKYLVEYWGRQPRYTHPDGTPVLTPNLFYTTIDELPSVAEALYDGRVWWVDRMWTDSHDIICWEPL